MALTQEDGTGGNPAANTYATMAEADAYWTDRNDPAWVALSTTAKEAALLLAMDYLETRPRYRGSKMLRDQPLAWPRSDVVDNDGFLVERIPTKLLTAQIELAYRSGVDATDLSPDIAAGGINKREKVDVVEIERFAGGPTDPVFPVVDRLLRPLTVSGTGLLRD